MLNQSLIFFIGKNGEEILARIVEITDSSNIRGVEYYPESVRMIVHFTNGDSYSYNGIGPAAFGALIAAESVGKHFNRMKHKYTGIKV